MSSFIKKYSVEVGKIFQIGVDVLNGARSLKNVSLDLQLLAYNGIVQAAKIGTNEGKSLITLSAFLSDLPRQIAPDLKDLEKMSSLLARQITVASINIRRFLQYNVSLDASLKKFAEELGDRVFLQNIDLSDVNDLQELSRREFHSEGGEIIKSNLKNLSNKNVDILKQVGADLSSAFSTMRKAEEKIATMKRSGFIANYMGSNILIESSYITQDKRSFLDLVNAIRNIVDTLDKKLDEILGKIFEGEVILKRLKKIGESK